MPLLRKESDLRAYFMSGNTHIDRRGVGTEHEKIGFRAKDLGAIPYDGKEGIAAMLKTMANRFEWIPEYENGKIVALARDAAAITLEPGGQFELSGRITKTIHETAHELQTHLQEVHAVAKDLNQMWIFLGLNPWLDISEVHWMPKARYNIMKHYLSNQGSQAHWMMKMTATVQANFDYTSEQDAMEILRLGAQLGPISTALFASSPYKKRKRSGWSTRMEIWENTDPDRCGTPEFLLQKKASFDDYVRYMVDMPMFFIKREGKYINLAGIPFRNLLEGKTKYKATWKDWELHLSTAFPTVRLKRYIELRTADCGPTTQILAYSALWKGILYDEQARKEAATLFPISTSKEAKNLAKIARIDGLFGTWKGKKLRNMASQLIEIARRGLDRQCVSGASEACYLDALIDENEQPISLAEQFVSIWERHKGNMRPILHEIGAIGAS